MAIAKPVIYYCYDAYCGWCYGFSNVMTKIFEEFKDRVDFETLSGGMIPVESAHHIGRMAGYIQGAYKNVEEMTGVKFGDEYLWHINNPDLSDWYPHSEKAAIAMAVFRDYHPDDTVLFAADLQKALHIEGRDLTDMKHTDICWRSMAFLLMSSTTSSLPRSIKKKPITIFRFAVNCRSRDFQPY